MKLKFLRLIPILLMAGTVLADHPTLSLEDGSPGPITTISATPLPAGTLSAAHVNQFIFFDAFSDAELLARAGDPDHVHSTDRVISSSLNTAYGVTDDFTLGFSLPYIWRTNLREGTGGKASSGEEDEDHHGGKTRLSKHAGEDHGDEDEEDEVAPATVESVPSAQGIGDATLYGQYRFLHDEAHDRQVSFITGLKMPTGRTDVRIPGGALLASHHQPGSGSWDPLVGLAFTQGLGRWSLDANLLYTFATDGTAGSNLGDVFNYNAAVSYRLLGAHELEHSAGDSHDHSAHEHPTTLDLILEANGDWRGEAIEGGTVDRNTGGNLVFLSGGTRLAWGHSWAATLSLGAPVIENLNGIQSEPTLRLLFGVSKAF